MSQLGEKRTLSHLNFFFFMYESFAFPWAISPVGRSPLLWPSGPMVCTHYNSNAMISTHLKIHCHHKHSFHSDNYEWNTPITDPPEVNMEQQWLCLEPPVCSSPVSRSALWVLYIHHSPCWPTLILLGCSLLTHCSWSRCHGLGMGWNVGQWAESELRGGKPLIIVSILGRAWYVTSGRALA